jgi:hypothetical protein
MDKELLSMKDVAKMLHGTEAWIKKSRATTAIFFTY